MLATGTLISAASIWEWQRLIRVINARLDKQKTPASAPVVVLFFVLRLTVFAGVIYGSLKCFHGSVGGASLRLEPGGIGHRLGSDPAAARLTGIWTETRLKQASRRMRSAARRRKDSSFHAGILFSCALAEWPLHGLGGLGLSVDWAFTGHRRRKGPRRQSGAWGGVAGRRRAHRCFSSWSGSACRSRSRIRRSRSPR